MIPTTMREALPKERQSVADYIDSISSEAGVQFYTEISVINELKSFIKFLDKQIDHELTRDCLSSEDAILKSATALAYEKDKNALMNIINGKHWNQNA